MVFRSHQFFPHVHVEIQTSTIGDRVPLLPWSMIWPTEYGIFDSDSLGSNSRTVIESPFPQPIWSVRSGSQFRLENRERTSSGWRRSRGLLTREDAPLLYSGKVHSYARIAFLKYPILLRYHYQVSVYQAPPTWTRNWHSAQVGVRSEMPHKHLRGPNVNKDLGDY